MTSASTMPMLFTDQCIAAGRRRGARQHLNLSFRNKRADNKLRDPTYGMYNKVSRALC